MEERRSARVGTVSGLALLAGGTAAAAVAGGRHSVFATILLALLTLGMGHALLVEIRRQATRRVPRWVRHDTANAVLLGLWSEISLGAAIFGGQPTVRVVGLALFTGYAGCCALFVTERRRMLTRLAALSAPSVVASPAATSLAVTSVAASPAATSPAATSPAAASLAATSPAASSLAASPAEASAPPASPAPARDAQARGAELSR